MSDNGIVWEDPPETRLGGKSVWTERLAPLLERPNTWARVKECGSAHSAHNTASHLKLRKMKVPPGRWDFAARAFNGKGYVYARYLGPEEKTSA